MAKLLTNACWHWLAYARNAASGSSALRRLTLAAQKRSAQPQRALAPLAAAIKQAQERPLVNIS